MMEIKDDFVKDYLYKLIEEFFDNFHIEIISDLREKLVEIIIDGVKDYYLTTDPFGMKFFKNYALTKNGCEEGMLPSLSPANDVLNFYCKYRTELDTLYEKVCDSTKISKLKRLVGLGNSNLTNVIKLYVWQLIDYIMLDIGKSYVKLIDIKYAEYIVDRFEYD